MISASTTTAEESIEALKSIKMTSVVKSLNTKYTSQKKKKLKANVWECV